MRNHRLEYGRSFGKVYAQVGLRYEHLTNDYFNFGKKEDEVCRNYGDWFPTAVISAPIGKAQLSLSYRRDIQRPAYSNLTSSTVYVNRYTYQSGNPYLLPTYTHSLVLNAAYKWANLTLNYSPCQPGASHQQLGGLQPVQHPVVCTPHHWLLASGMECHHPDAGLQVAYC